MRIQSVFLFWLCFINEITKVNRFVHRHSAVAKYIQINYATLCATIRSEFNNKIFHEFVRSFNNDDDDDDIHHPVIGKCAPCMHRILRLNNIIIIFRPLTLMRPQFATDVCIRCCAVIQLTCVPCIHGGTTSTRNAHLHFIFFCCTNGYRFRRETTLAHIHTHSCQIAFSTMHWDKEKSSPNLHRFSFHT